MAAWDVLFTREGRQVEGVEEPDLKRMLKAGELRPEDCVRRAGETRWRQVAELRGAAKPAPAAVAVAAPEPEPEPAPVVAVAAEPAPAAEAPLSFDDEDEAEVDFGDHTHQEGLDMTPMVDVVLLLLLFFMVTASYSMQKIMTMNKPDPNAKKTAVQTRQDLSKDNVMVEIDHRNVISVDGELLRGKELMRNLVSRAAREGNKTKAIVVADGDSHNSATVKALDGIREAGIADINYQVKTDD